MSKVIASTQQNEDYALNGIVLREAIALHQQYGPLLLENFYRVALMNRLRTKHGLDVKTEVPITVVDEGCVIDVAYRMDLVVNDILVIEIKSTEANLPVYERQLLTYLKLANKRYGMLLNFGYPRLVDGYKHFIN